MTEPPSWVHSMLGGVLKSQILDPKPGSPLHELHKRMVDCVCRCGTRLAMVTDEPEGPWFTAWYPTVIVRGSNEGEPLWTIQAGHMPGNDGDVILHCFEHGRGSLAADELLKAVDTYRSRGRTVRLVIKAPR